MKNLNNNPLKSKNVLVRVDLNVPVVNGNITDKSRIDAIKLTIDKLQKNKNKIFLLSHYGRPKGQKSKDYSLKFICESLKEELKINKINFLDNFIENQIKNMITDMESDEICLFENIRFWSEEENNDLNFAKKISKHFDAYVNDAFSASHRNHASIVGIPEFLPSFAGDNMLKEIKNINKFVNKPKKPNLAIIGGSKISTKINLLHNLVEHFDVVAIGGAMANTFLYANKIKMGSSLYEKDLSEIALSIIKKAKTFNSEIILPIDVICADSLKDKINIRQCDVINILPNQMVLDIGSKTIKLISNYILKSNMVLWNGPLGAFEYKPFEQSSIDIANLIKKNTKLLNISAIAGGGDTVSVIKMAKAEDGFSYISNAGGAFLEWLEGKELTGIVALRKNKIN